MVNFTTWLTRPTVCSLVSQVASRETSLSLVRERANTSGSTPERLTLERSRTFNLDLPRFAMKRAVVCLVVSLVFLTLSRTSFTPALAMTDSSREERSRPCRTSSRRTEDLLVVARRASSWCGESAVWERSRWVEERAREARDWAGMVERLMFEILRTEREVEREGEN